MATDNELKWAWEYLEETDSTNRVAMERILECWGRGERADRRVVVARRQTAGRGQHGRSWESPEGGLYMSMVVEDVPAEWRERLALVKGLVVVEACEICPALRLRWPNDVMVDGKKIAGILCQGVAQGARWAAVIGIGVNVENVAFSPGLEGVATSFWVQGVRLSREGVAHRIAARWDQTVRERPGLAEVAERVRRRDALLGLPVRLDDGGQVWEGTGAGIDGRGRLCLRLADGQIRAFERGTLRH